MSLNEGAIAARYAQAVFELGVEANQLAPLTSQLQKLAEVYEGSADLRSVLQDPLVGEPARTEILKALAARLGITALALNTVRVLTQRRRLFALPAIARRLAALADEKAGIVRVTVTSAAALPESVYAELTKRLEKLVGGKVVLERAQDPSLLGGLVTQLGDHTIDGSVRGRLERLQRQIIQA